MSGPVLSPTEMRARLVASYLDSYRRASIPHTVEGLTRLAVSDLEMVDAARRAGELASRGRSAPDPEKQAERAGALEREVAKVGGGAKLRDRTGYTTLTRRLTHRNPQESDARWSAAVARLKRILEGSSGKTLASAAGDTGTKLRPLARQYAEQWALYLVRVPFPHPCGVGCRMKRNPYCNVTDADADRMFRRAVEDICDRSTGVLGGWYVR